MLLFFFHRKGPKEGPASRTGLPPRPERCAGLECGCPDNSRRNHNRTIPKQNASLGTVWKSLQYVVTRRPKAVVVENVDEVGATGPMEGLLTRLQGYTIDGGMLDPRTVAHAPIARERHFWLLTRTDAHTD